MNYKRYSRQIVLSEIGSAGQKKINNASVLVVGAGGLGSPVLLYLSAAGVGRIGIVDGDQVDESNFQRQVLFNENQLGQNKANAAAERLHGHNSAIRIDSHPCFITPHNARKLMKGYDLIIDGCDNFSTRYLISDVACALGIPVVSGALQGFQGQVTVLNKVDENGPSYRCLFPTEPGEKLNCAVLGVLGSVAGWAGTVMVHEALKIIVGFGDVLSGKIMLIDGLNNTSLLINAQRNPELYRQSVQNGQAPQKVDYGRAASDMKEELEISCAGLYKLIGHNPHIKLVDIREQSKPEPGLELIHLAYSKISEPGFLWPFKQQAVLICDFGAQSMRLVEKVKSTSDANIISLSGGFLAWSLYHEENIHVT